MASMNYVPGVGFVKNIPGTDRTVVMGSDEERAFKEAAIRDRNNFLRANRFNVGKDYSGDFEGLYGAEKGGDLYYEGPNDRWWHALNDRLRERRGGNYNNTGYYEGSTGTVDRNLQRQMYRRNNAIEDMYRRGYSQEQLRAHLSGERNVLSEGPDWSDYDPEMSDYFIGEPGSTGDSLFNTRANYRFQQLGQRFEQLFGGDNNPFDRITKGLFGDYL